MKRASLALVVAGVVSLGLTGGSPVGAQGAKPATTAKPAATTPPAPKPYVAPVKGTASIGILKPVVKTDTKAKEVVSTMKVTNLTKGAIVRLECEDIWYDKQGNALQGGDTFILRQPLNPGEVVTFELRSAYDAKMDRNLYRCKHANGSIAMKTLTKF